MRRLSILVALVATFALAGSVFAGSATLKTFGDGDVTIITANSATIVNDVGEYGGVYINSKANSGKLLSTVDFSFTSTGDVAGGAPRFSLPIDIDGNGKTDLYAFLAPDRCGGVSDDTTVVSTTLSNCLVDLNTPVAGTTTFANWDALAAEYPTWRITPGSIPFIIADAAGIYAVSGISLR